LLLLLVFMLYQPPFVTILYRPPSFKTHASFTVFDIRICFYSWKYRQNKKLPAGEPYKKQLFSFKLRDAVLQA